MDLCQSLISQDIQKSCDDPLVKGFKKVGVIINREDIDYVNSVTAGNVISTLKVATGKKGYWVETDSNNPFNGTNTEMVANDIANTFTNTLAFVVLNNDPDVCENIIDKLKSGEFVVVLQAEYDNAHKAATPSDSVFRVFGWQRGLKASAISNNAYSDETGGGWLVNLQEVEVPKSGLFMYNTDYATTKAAFDALTTTAV